METYIKIPNIKGNVTTKGYEHWIKIDSYYFSGKRNLPTITTGNTTDRNHSIPLFGEVEMTKEMDKATPLLFQHWTQAQNINQLQIVSVQTSDALMPYLQYTLGNVIISGVSHFNDGGGARPYEIMTLNYTTIEQKFTPYDATHRAQAPITAGFNIEKSERL